MKFTQPTPAAIANKLASLGITAGGACNLTPEDWRHIERFAGATLLTHAQKLEVLSELVNIECQLSEMSAVVKQARLAKGVGA